MLDRMIERVEKESSGKPDYAQRLVALAEDIASQGHHLKAYKLCRQAITHETAPEPLKVAVRRLMNRIIPGYHIPMMNDARRNVAWDKALRKAVKPGMKVLEIGTGAGMLTLMAARAGADKVTTCEYHHVVAEVARDIVAANGYADKVTVLTKGSLQMQLGTDLEEPADLLFCDNFSDDFFSFQPLNSIADARARLLKPGAPCMPARAAVRLALCEWDGYPRYFKADESCGFDISLAELLPSESIDLELGDPGVHLRSEHKESFRFDFAESLFPSGDSVELVLRAEQDGIVNGICQWIRLELDDEIFLEAKPEAGARFFSNPRFHPFAQPVEVKAGDVFRVFSRHNGQQQQIYCDGRPIPTPAPV